MQDDIEEDNGHYVCYVPRNFNAASLNRIKDANTIIGKYEGAGMIMTLRQLYYQMVSKNMIENTDTSYANLQSLISSARLAGLVSWTAIEDRGRNLKGWDYKTSPINAVKALREGYRIDKWVNQPWRPEVWVEKKALEGVIGQICSELDVDFFACSGYNSQSEQWRAGRRFADYLAKGQRPIVFHLGDHDPSGIDMTRDNTERLAMFAGTKITLVRLALNMNQIEQYNPPPNPAKFSDSRIGDYIKTYNTESSWELDALEPEVMHDLIREAVMRVRDEELWDRMLRQEAEDKMELEDMIGRKDE